MVSIICASNNENILRENLIKSLNNQTYKDYELIIVNTNQKKYNSATEALTEGIKKSNGKYLIFVHHDVVFKDKNELANLVKYTDEIDDFGIIGVAGAPYKKEKLIGNITDGKDKKYISDKKINSPSDVQTIDEVLFIIKREILEKYSLEQGNKTWHLYAVEYCLLMKENNKRVMVVPSNIYHLSSGASLNNSYYDEIKRICKIYKNKLKTINTTVGFWNTNVIILNIQILKHKIEHKIS